MNEKIVIFGASVGGIKVAQTLNSFDIDFCFFVDNDKKKWGTKIPDLGKIVLSPENLREDSYQIVIASEHQGEIEKQLESMGLLSSLILKEDLIIPCVENMVESFRDKYITESNVNKGNKSVIIDLAEGVQLGGIETWSYLVAHELDKMEIDTKIFAKKTEMLPPDNIRERFFYLDIEYYNFKENVCRLAFEIVKQKPCAVIINKHTQMFYAAYLAKQICKPEDIRIISVIHNDSVVLYRRQRRIDGMTDAVLCVSKKIREHMVLDYDISPQKVFYKESPVYFDKDYDGERAYTEKFGIPISIGYAARLTKFQKRADLFPKLIAELNRLHCDYQLLIAGDGGYRVILEEYIKKNDLEDRVKLVGRLEPAQIPAFWRKRDVFISLSDFEGSSISALEAMSQGAIPVETDVSGVGEFVENGKNGYIVSLEDMRGMAEAIAELERHRDRLKRMGRMARQIVEEKCQPKDYGIYIAGICGIENIYPI